MSTLVPPASHGRWHAMRKAAGRVPLRIKLITAVLTLVAIALAVISVASIVLFRDYQLRRASQQVTAVLYEYNNQLGTPYGLHPGEVDVLGAYLVAMRPVGSSLRQPPGVSSIPDIPSTPAWLAANSGRLVDVSAVTGTDNWRVITREVTYQDPFGQTTSRDTLIVGVDLGDINGTIGRLAYIDLIVSLIVLGALAMVGVAIVRTSMRPLKDIEDTAGAIAAGDLSRRVPYHDPRTEMGRLSRSLNVMLAHVESAFRARARSEAAARHSEERMRRFVADASHELRTPLTAIRGYAEYYRQLGGMENGSAAATTVAAEGGAAAGDAGAASAVSAEAGAAAAIPAEAAPPATAVTGSGTMAPASMAGAPDHNEPLSELDTDRIMERIEQESSRMGGLVEDMLVLARLDEQRPIERHPVDLLTLAADAVQDARIVAPSRAIDLTVGAGTAFLVLGDEARLRQVISNLMNNALTHTSAGSPINVQIHAGQQAGNPPVPSAVLEVTDHGPGLTPEQANRVFERFYRADQARGRRTGGSGLGLAIVEALVAAHGGTVSVDTGPGRGATFRITLPLAPEALAIEPSAD